MTVEVKILREGDAAILANVAPGVFDDPLDASSTEAFLRDPRHHLVVAIDQGVVVGFVSAMHYVHPDKPRPELWINEVGVAPTHRSQGIGRKLVNTILELGSSVGSSEAWVLTDRSNAQAMRLYASLGGIQKPDSVMFTFRLDVIVRREEISSAPAMSLIAALNAELSSQYPEGGATHFRLDPEEVAEGTGAFMVAYKDGVSIGCGAVRLLDGNTAELKRMYVTPAARGQGIGRALLAALEAEAHRIGARRLLLETGIRQDAALHLYERSGFCHIEPYGEYRQSPKTSVCMAKEL
jgi:ribosomal protein S18 acetylase RimI-like enzyme